MQIPKKIAEREVLSNLYRNILEKDFREKDGNIYTYHVVKVNGTKQATMILPLTESWDIVLQKEYRVGTEEVVYQFAIGILEKGLSEEKNCKKELKEETGYSSKNFTKLWKSIVEYYYDGHINYYIAQNCTKGTQNLEVGENIEVMIVSKEKFISMIKNGTINCPFTLACYTLAQTKWLI